MKDEETMNGRRNEVGNWREKMGLKIFSEKKWTHCITGSM